MEREPTEHRSRKQPSGGRVVRDSFTMPDADHRLIRELQITYARVGVLFNKGEVLRAGLHALKNMTPEELSEIAGHIEHLKGGRGK